MTNRQFISDIRSDTKMTGTDALITNRALLSIAKTCAMYLIKQQTDRRKLFQSPNLFTPIPCLKMKNVPLAECCEYVSERIVSRSVEKLPKIGESIFGLLIQYVMSVEKSTKFNETTATRYANLLKLSRPTNKNFYWIHNDYLYVSKEDIKAVAMNSFFEEEVPVSILCPDDCDCVETKNCDSCENPLDREFRCPGYLLSTVRQMVIKELLTSYYQLPEDRTSDNKDDQSK